MSGTVLPFPDRSDILVDRTDDGRAGQRFRSLWRCRRLCRGDGDRGGHRLVPDMRSLTGPAGRIIFAQGRIVFHAQKIGNKFKSGCFPGFSSGHDRAGTAEFLSGKMAFEKNSAREFQRG